MFNFMSLLLLYNVGSVWVYYYICHSGRKLRDTLLTRPKKYG